MTVGFPTTSQPNSAAKSVDIATQYLYIEPVRGENSFIIIDQVGDIGGESDPYINHDGDDDNIHWEVLPNFPSAHRHIKVWADTDTRLIVKARKLQDTLDWRPVHAPLPSGLTECKVDESTAGDPPRIAVRTDKVYGIQYEDPATGITPRTKDARALVLTSTLTLTGTDDYVYIELKGTSLVYYRT